MGKTKQTKRPSEVPKKTIAKVEVSYENQIPAWVFDKIDRNGKFAFSIDREDFNLHEVLDKMISYSSMTWGQMKLQTHDDGKSKHHYLDVGDLSKEARDRLTAMHMEDCSDQIYSIALQNTLRIIGLREKDRFHVLWYDPKHEVCPSKKKNT